MLPAVLQVKSRYGPTPACTMPSLPNGPEVAPMLGFIVLSDTLYWMTNLSPNSLTGPSTRRSGEIAALNVKPWEGPTVFSRCSWHFTGVQTISCQNTVEAGL